MPSASSNIVLSGPAGSDKKLKYVMNCKFDAPPNVAGKSCNLKTYFFNIQSDDSTTTYPILPPHTIWSISIDFGQPNSFISINDTQNYDATTVKIPDALGWSGNESTPSSTAKIITNKHSHRNTKSIGLVTTDSNGLFNGIVEYPICMVNIPDGRQTVTVTLLKLNGSDSLMTVQSLQQMTLGFNLTPI